MNILFDINHPAHVHLFKNAISILKKAGHKVIVTAREKDVTLNLLKNLGIEHAVLSKARKGLLGLGLELFWRQIKIYKILKAENIDVCVSVTGACNVYACKLLNIPSLVFYDTEHATLQNKLTIPFATGFFTPEHFQAQYGKNHFKYKGTHDIAYLHPSYFQADQNVLQELDLKEGEPFTIMRFVSWQAAHDVGQQGIPYEAKKEILENISKFGKVYIVSETPLIPEFQKYELRLSSEKILDLLAFASLYIGEGGSMATEAAVLGTPSIFISSLRAGVFSHLEKSYDLMYCFSPHEITEILAKINLLLSDKTIKKQWQDKSKLFINDTIDLTEHILHNISKYANLKQTSRRYHSCKGGGNPS